MEDEDNAEIVLFEESLGVVLPGRQGFFCSESSNLFGLKSKNWGDLSTHGAVCRGVVMFDAPCREEKLTAW